MPKIKGSSLIASELLFQEKFISYHKPWNPDWEREHEPRMSVCSNTLEVPETKSNPLVNGYRNPSDYWLNNVCYWPNIGFGRAAGYVVQSVVNRTENVARDDYYGRSIFTAEGTMPVMYWQPKLPGYYNLVQHARTKILNNIKGEAFDVAMVLAEIRETATTGANLMLRIGRSLDAVRRRNPESFRYLMHGNFGVDKRRPSDRSLREAAGVFLEWKYGIMPSIYDLEGITKSLDAAKDGSLFDRPPLMVARTHVKQVDTVDCDANFPLGKPSSVPRPVKIETTIACRADFRVSGEGMRDLSEYGLGLGTVATVLYDKTPFSFVANMIVPMAEIMKAWTALAGVEMVGYTETQYSKVTSPAFMQDSTHQSWKMQHKVGALKYNTFTRLGTTSPPMPLPYVRNPIKVSNLSTVLALFTQLRKPENPRLPKLYGFDNKGL